MYTTRSINAAHAATTVILVASPQENRLEMLTSVIIATIMKTPLVREAETYLPHDRHRLRETAPAESFAHGVIAGLRQYGHVSMKGRNSPDLAQALGHPRLPSRSGRCPAFDEYSL